MENSKSGGRKLKRSVKGIGTHVRDDVTATLALLIEEKSRLSKFEEDFREDLLNDLAKLEKVDFHPDAAKVVTVEKVCLPKHIHTPLKFVASVHSIDTPTYLRWDSVDLSGEPCERDQRITRMVLGNDHKKIPTCAITRSPLIQRVEEKHLADVAVVVHATPIKLPRGSRTKETALLVHDLMPVEDGYQLLNPSHKEISDVEKLISKLSKKPRGIFRYLKNEIVESKGLVQLEELPSLDLAIDGAIFQSTGTGRIGKFPAKPHIFLLGPPGVGKQSVTETAKILNPVFDEIQPGKSTVAGIVGYSRPTEKGWESKPGILSSCHLGGFSIQDFQSLPSSLRGDIVNVFATLTQEGVVRNSASGGAKYELEVGIILDANRLSDILKDPKRAKNVVADISLPTHLISRIDLCVHWHKDPVAQFETALQMYSTLSQPSASDSQEFKRYRQLKLIVAYLRKIHPIIEYPPDVRKQMQRLHRDLFNANEKNLHWIEDIADFQVRTMQSVSRWVAAIARCDNRSIANVDDVDLAFKFIGAKYEFIRETVLPDLKTVKSWGANRKQSELRQEAICARFGGKRVTIKKVASYIADEFDLKVTSEKSHLRTITRDLKAIDACVVQGKKGWWKIPK